MVFKLNPFTGNLDFATDAVWGEIIGTLSNQADLQAALNGKSDTGHTHIEADITDLDKYTQAEVDTFFEGEDSGKKQVHWDRVTNKPTVFPTDVNVQEDDIDVVLNLKTLNFEGDVNITDEGSGKTTVTIGEEALNATKRMGWRMAPTVNGDIFWLGWYILTDTAELLNLATPVTSSEPGFNSHFVIEVTNVVSTPFDITVTGTSVDELTSVQTPGDTEIISITANGFYQTVKCWLTDVTFSVTSGTASCNIDIYRITYWDKGNTDFKITGHRLEFTPDNPIWEMHLKMYKINNDGSRTIFDEHELLSTDLPPYAATDMPGRHKRGGQSIIINGTQMEGLIVEVYVKAIADFYLEVQYQDGI